MSPNRPNAGDQFNPASSNDPLLGRCLGRYRILSMIGRGGMGCVYRAEHVDLGKSVALKILPPERMSSADASARFLREARAAAGLEHPNVVTVHDVGQEQGLLYLVMQFIDGPSVARLVRTRGPLSPPEAVKIALGVARGLGAAHSKGVIHRDVKPDNILISKQRGEVKLTDFGLARAVEDEDTLTQIGEVLGTPGYIAPELSASEGPVDHRCDLYSLGATLFQMLSGQAPFRGTSALATIVSSLQEPAPSVCELQPTVPYELGAVVASLLERNPDARPQTCLEVEQQLNSALNMAQTGETMVGVDPVSSESALGALTPAQGNASTQGVSFRPPISQQAARPTVALPVGSPVATGGTVSMPGAEQSDAASPPASSGSQARESPWSPALLQVGVALAAAVLVLVFLAAFGDDHPSGAGQSATSTAPSPGNRAAVVDSKANPGVTPSTSTATAEEAGGQAQVEELRKIREELASLENVLSSDGESQDVGSLGLLEKQGVALQDRYEVLRSSVGDDLDLLLDVGDLGDRLDSARQRLQQRLVPLRKKPPVEPQQAAEETPAVEEPETPDASSELLAGAGARVIEPPSTTGSSPREGAALAELPDHIGRNLLVTVMKALREGRYGVAREIGSQQASMGGDERPGRPSRGPRPRDGRGPGGPGRGRRGGDMDRPPREGSQQFADLIGSVDVVLHAALQGLKQRAEDREPVDLFLREKREWLPCVVQRVEVPNQERPELAKLFLRVHKHPEKPLEKQVEMGQLWGGTLTELARQSQSLDLRGNRNHRDGAIFAALSTFDLFDAWRTFEASGRSPIHPLLARWAQDVYEFLRVGGQSSYLDDERRARKVLKEAAELHRKGEYRAEEYLLRREISQSNGSSTLSSVQPALDRHLRWLSMDVNQRVAAKSSQIFRAMLNEKAPGRGYHTLEYEFGREQPPNVMGDWVPGDGLAAGAVSVVDRALVLRGDPVMVTFGPRWRLGNFIVDLTLDDAFTFERSELVLLWGPAQKLPCLWVHLKSLGAGKGLRLECFSGGTNTKGPQPLGQRGISKAGNLRLKLSLSSNGLLVTRAMRKGFEEIFQLRIPAGGDFPLIGGSNYLTVVAKSPNGNVRIRRLLVTYLPELGFEERQLDPRAERSHEAVQLPDDLPQIDDVFEEFGRASEPNRRR